MEIQEIVSTLRQADGRFPSAAIEEAVARREEIVPALLEILEGVERDPQPYLADPKRMEHIYAMFLLAQFRETRAYPLLVRIFSAPAEISHDLTGDIAAIYLGRILASVSDGEIDGITSLIENKQADEYVRSSALSGLLTLVECGKRSREEIMAYYGSLFHKLDRTANNMWNELAVCCARLGPTEVIQDLRQAYEDNLIEPFLIRPEQIEKAFAAGRDAAMGNLKNTNPLISDAESEMSWWPCFREDEETPEQSKPALNTAPAVLYPVPAAPSSPAPYRIERQEPIRNTSSKIGRNESCPCGSGKKFKKCCGR